MSSTIRSLQLESTTPISQIEFRQAVFRFYEPNLVYVRYIDESQIDLEGLTEMINGSLDMINDIPFVAMVDLRGLRGNMSPEAMKFSATYKRLTDAKLAEAIVVSNLGMRILANFYVKIKSHKTPVRVFSNTQKALNWLDKYKG